MATEPRGVRSSEELERDELLGALRARERFLTGILGSLESFVTIDREWRFTFVNEAAAEHLDASAAELLGADVREVVPGGIIEQARSTLREAMSRRCRADVVLGDGRGGHFHCTAFPLADGGLAISVRDVTERVRAEQELRESRRLLQTVLENSRDGINMLDLASGRYVFMNDAQVRLTGFTTEEINGISAQEAYERVHPDDRHISVEQQRRIASGEDSDALVEYRWRVKSGEYRWFSDRRRLVRDDSGTPVALVGISRDITDAKQAQEALRASEERYHSLFESIEEGFALAELVRDEEGRAVDYRYLDVNPVFERELKVTRGQAVGHLRSEVAPEDMDMLAWCVAAIESGHPVRCELYSTVWRRWFDATVLPRGGDQFALLFEDVTSRKAAESALRESEARFRGVFTSGAAAIAVADASGRLVLVNDAFARLVGRTREELVGMEYAALTFPEDLERELVFVAEMQAGARDAYELEKRYVRRDGSVVWVDVHVGMLLGDDGRPRYAIAVAVDLTERKRAEQALRETAAAQAAQAERTRIARDLHDSVTQALFAATMKSEALLVRDNLPLPAMRDVRDVRRLNRGALAQMRTLLLELRGDPLEEVPLEQLLGYAVEAAESRCSAEIVLDVSGAATLLPAVHLALYRICQEALNNVARHSGATQVSVRLEFDEGEAHLYIGDDGFGFALEAIDPSHYGLRSMRERAEEAGAALAVETAPGAGTTVTVDWPAA